MALATETRPLSEAAFLDELCAGRVLVVGVEAEQEAQRVLPAALLSAIRVQVSAKLPPAAWELY